MSRSSGHSGYLYKYSKNSSWKKRLFLIKGSILSYFENKNNLDPNALKIYDLEPNGELLIFAETKIIPCSFEDKPFCLSLAEPFAPLMLACSNDKERQTWLKYFLLSVQNAKKSFRQYAYRRNESQGIAKKKYFILHQSCITYHKNSDELNTVQGFIHLDRFSSLTFNDNYLLFDILDNKIKKTMSIQFKVGEFAEQDIYDQWKSSIIETLMKVGGEIKNVDGSNNFTGNFIVKEGTILVRPIENFPENAEDWPRFTLRLTDTVLFIIDSLEKDDLNAQVTEILITPNCSVFETNLGTHSFEIVSAKRVAHFMADTAELSNEWIDAIRAVIANSYLDTNDPIYQQALFRIDEDYYYEIEFLEKKPLGLVFERANDWAIVKHSPSAEQTGVRPGYVLSSLNGNSVILEPYQNVIDILRNWQPPLVLGFRVPPEKVGFLLKETRSRRSPSKSVWKKRYFILSSGVLSYKESPDSERAVTFPLMGSAVSLITPQDIGKFFCFRIISGAGSIVMQSSSERSMMDWASSLYHAAAMANGGGHILQYERDRVNAMEQSNQHEAILLNNYGSSDSHDKSWINQNMEAPSEVSKNSTLAAIMMRASYENTTELEDAILIAKNQQINVSGAVKLLEEIQINRITIDDLQNKLNKAIDDMSLPELESILPICEEIGIIDCHNARLSLDKLKTETLEKELIESYQASLDANDWSKEQEYRIAAAIEAAKSNQVLEVSPNLINAQMRLIQLRRHRADRDVRRQTLISAIQSENLLRIEASMKDALTQGFDEKDKDILHAKTILETAEINKTEALLQAAIINSDINDYVPLQDAIAHINNDGNSRLAKLLDSEVYEQATTRLNELIELQPIKEKVIQDIKHAIDEQAIDKLETALEEATKMKILSEEIDEGHSSLLRMKSDDNLIAYWASVAEEKKRASEEAEAENKRKVDLAENALDGAIESSKTEPINIAIDTISIALENAKLNNVDKDKVDEGSKVLEQLQLQQQQSDDDKRIKEEGIITEINRAVELNDIELLEKATNHALSETELELQEHPTVLDGLNTITELRIEELIAAIEISTTISDFDNLKQILRKAEWLEALILKRKQNSSNNDSNEVKNESFIEKLRLAKERLKNLEYLKQQKTDAEVALESAMREVPLSVTNLEHAINIAKNCNVNVNLLKHASDILYGLIISDAERKLISSMMNLNIDNIEPLHLAISYANEKKVDSFKLNEAVQLVAKIKEFIEILNNACDSQSIEALEEVMITACNLKLEGSKIEYATSILKELRHDSVNEKLEFALTEATLDDFDILIDAINEAKDYGIEGSNITDAQMVLDALINQKDSITEVIDFLSIAIENKNVSDLKSGIAKAERVGYNGEVYDGAKSILLILLQSEAVEKLEEAMSIDYKDDYEFDQLYNAIANAENLGVHSDKIDDAKELLESLIKNRDEKAYIVQLLKAAMAAKSIDNLHLALEQADAIPDFDEDLMDEALELLESLEFTVKCEKIMLYLNDAIRIRSIKSLTKAISKAEGANITDPLVDSAKKLLSELQEELEKSGFITSNNNNNITNDDDDEDDDELNETNDNESTNRTPRKLARRKSKRYSFNSKDAATAEDLYKVFYNHGIKTGTIDKHSGFLNPMQFSNIWRMITNEKGNLFREMQMFKKFDTTGIGALSSEDFVLGFINLAHEQKNDDLLKRIKSLASEDNLIIDEETKE